MKRRTSRIWKTVGLLLLTPVILVALLQTPPGKAMLATFLSSTLSRSENMDVRIGKISGWIPAKVDIADIAIGDSEGIWLRAENLHFRWMIRELVDERIRLRQLSADELELYRFPRSGKKAPAIKSDSRGFDLLEIALNGLRIKKLKLGKGVAGMPLNYAVHSGGISLLTSGRLSGELVVTGDAEGLVELDALLVGNGQDQLTIKAELEQMVNPTFGLDSLSGQGEATISSKGVDGRIAARLEKDELEGHISTELRYARRNLHLDQFEFRTGEQSATGNLALGFSENLIDVELNSTYLDSHTNRFNVHGIASVITSNATWAVDVATLEIEGWEAVSFILSGRLDPNAVNLAGDLVEFDIGLLPMGGFSNFTGKVNGQLSVSGSLDAPEVVAGVKVDRFASAQQALDELPELDFSIAAGVLNGQLFGSTTITNYGSGFFTASFAMPCAFSIAPYNYRPQPDEFRGKLEADLDIGVFNNLAILDNQYLEGALEADLVFDHLKPSGYLKLKEGRYEHYDWGVVFRDLEADLVATQTGFEFEHASATDGYAGGLALSGGFGRGGMDIQLELDGAKVLQRPEVEAQVSGKLKVKGRVARPEVSGTLVIDRADILLDNMVSAQPLVLTDFNVYAETNTVASIAGKKALPFSMDIRVEMPDQVYVVASLIDSVWGGILRVRDTPAGISVEGKVEPRRGYVNFIGKKFRFQEGEVVLDGSVPPEPAFNNLIAEYSRSDITARLLLNGRVNDPQFRLESTPALPEDEILSQVLFNRDTTTISAYQAYQIAMAAQQLSGGLNGPGFMYQFRQAVGVDTLEWREADAAGGTSSVAAGKYITPGLYVEVSSSFDTEAETGMMAEYEITRHFSVETSTGPQMRPGIGVNWKNDY
jgi:autotransporter translocation and assembly factor TamB